MKHLFLLILILSGSTVAAYSKPPTQPFILRGQLKNFTKTEMIFFFKDPATNYRDYVIDTVAVDKDGSFTLKSQKIKTATIATLRSENISMDVYAAPGYDLTVSGDVQDLQKFHLNKKISGKGAEASKFILIMDSVNFARNGSKPWYEMEEKELLQFIRSDERTRDSIYNSVFARKINNDPWFNHFGKTAKLDNKFMKLYYLFNLVLQSKTLDDKAAQALIRNNFDNKILDNLYSPEYMISSNYTGWLTYIYPYYLRHLSCLKDSNYCKDKNEKVQLIEKIATNFKGPIKELKLYVTLNSTITYSRSFEELNLYKKELPAYIAQLQSKKDQKTLVNLVASMDTTLLRTQIGNAAPTFTAKDSLGKEYRIADYKGKVVYIDLWASWCSPCRYETPFLQQLVNKYKSNNQLQFISVAVMDQYEKWKQALIKDQPDWLQLYDHGSMVQNAYVANSIPKFILINKQGNIVSFDAAAPSSGAAIEKALEEELAK